ncbi:hypothetical protein G7Y89_g548 [Cudoniella acicularis]|uniref:MYB DNA-binding domain-containing protein n=1 Tax=Cudoniella acicularis TaxID=354080 RepID=A0A8H4RX01_9HELO|nr:hypothetical protein G7Y89_g548 [Cudoniella acicularis]
MPASKFNLSVITHDLILPFPPPTISAEHEPRRKQRISGHLITASKSWSKSRSHSARESAHGVHVQGLQDEGSFPNLQSALPEFYRWVAHSVHERRHLGCSTLVQLDKPSPDSNESASPTHNHHTRYTSVTSTEQSAELPSDALASSGAGGKRSMPAHPAESPAKKQSKWSAEEDALIIDLRGGGMKWEDISKRLPGRSAISCRLHYQNYLERRSEWNEERKNKLARLYEKFKPEMWSKVAEELGVPCRAAEAMHWQLGEADMASRAGVVPFSLSGITADVPSCAMSGRPSSGSSFSRPATAHSAPSSTKRIGGGSPRTIAARVVSR